MKRRWTCVAGGFLAAGAFMAVSPPAAQATPDPKLACKKA